MNPKEVVGVHAASLVQSGMLVGLGTGSTSGFFIRELARRIKREKLRISAVASSHASSMLAMELGIPLVGMEQVDRVDVYVDGADEVTAAKQLIKGRGAAMLREKVLAAAASRFIVIIDESKLVDRLGTRFPVPVEVVPLAYALVNTRIRDLGGKPQLRQAVRKDGPVITDSGNFVLDTEFPDDRNLPSLDAPLNAIPGLVEHGLFCDLADRITVLVGGENGVREWPA